MDVTNAGPRLFLGCLCTLVLATSGCQSDQSSTPAAAPTGVRIDAELGYPRDLLDCGRVNLVITRQNDIPFVVISKQLLIDHFSPATPEDGRTLIPSTHLR